MAYSADAYARMLKRLLPPGRLWNLLPDSVLSKVMLAMGDELARVDTRGAALIEETDPRTATETLPDWERMLGLPDEDVTAIPDTIEKRRLAITEKLTRRVGAQSPSYFIDRAARCGYTVTIKDDYASSVFRVDYSSVEEPLNEEPWAHYWVMTVQPPTGPALSHEELERIVRRSAPAHTYVDFVYL